VLLGPPASESHTVVREKATGVTQRDIAVPMTLLVRQKKRAQDRLRIVVPAVGHVREVFDVTGLQVALGIAETIEAASADGH
jgi:hypothetical protein